MDPLNFIHLSLYSKIITEVSNFNIHPFYIGICYIIFLLYRDFYFCCKFYKDYFYKDYCTIILGYHKRNIQLYHGRNITQINYSEKYYAINHYIFTHNIKNLDSLYEIINIKEDNYYENANIEYILVPNNYNKIKICENPEIYFENIIEEKEEDTSNNSNSSNNSSNNTSSKNCKYFTYCLSMRGKHNIYVLQEFINKCEQEYLKTKKTAEQMVYEYLYTSLDDNDHKEMKFNKYIFKSNKWLDRNIFFDNKREFIENIRKFPYRKDSDKQQIAVKTEAEKEYEYRGKSFKNAILLHGPPGCGKTSLIKGILNETKRHAVIVQWSRIKTCAEFSSLFRSLKINSETYSLGELCYIFEDFDANKMDLLKKRKNIGTMEEMPTEIVELLETDSCDSQNHSNHGNNVNKSENKSNKKIILPSIISLEDELTLDYVLNVFDGIIELYNAIIIFTTNAKLEYFDPALIRPGRIDTIIELKECSRQTSRNIIQYYFRLSDDEMAKCEMDLLALPEYVIRPSELEELCIKSCDVNDVIQKIANFTRL